MTSSTKPKPNKTKKYITYCTAVRTGPTGNTYRNLVKFGHVVLIYAIGHTRQTDSETQIG